MLKFVAEKQTVWEHLRQTEKPILLYGMGDGADKILKVFSDYGISCDGIFASDEFVRGHSFRGFRVMTYVQACEAYPDFIAVLAFAAFTDELRGKICRIAKERELYAPDVPVAGTELFTLEYLREKEEALRQGYELLADEQSKRVFSAVVNFKLSGKIDYLEAVTTSVEEIYHDILPPEPQEVYLDLGAYNGDTVREFLSYAVDYEKIIAAEPDVKNYRKLEKYIEENGLQRVEARNIGVWDSAGVMHFDRRAGRNSALSQNAKEEVAVDSIDGILDGKRVTTVKMDVEGAERQAILGGTETLRRYAPKLNIAAYHRTGDFFELPLLLRELNPKYRIYLRHHPYIPAWETNLYAKL